MLIENRRLMNIIVSEGKDLSKNAGHFLQAIWLPFVNSKAVLPLTLLQCHAGNFTPIARGLSPLS